MTASSAAAAVIPKVIEDAVQSHAIVSFWLAGRQFGLPLRDVREVLSARPITPIPLAPSDIIGSFSLRGRIVTVVDMRRRLNMPPRAAGAEGVTVVVEWKQDVFGLAVDAAGDVLAMDAGDLERHPPAVDSRLQDCADTFYRHAGQSLVLLDIDRLLNQSHPRSLSEY